MSIYQLVDQFMGRSVSNAHFAPSKPMVSGLAGGAALGGVAGLLMGSKNGRKLAASAVKYGGIAAIGALAYRAWRQRNDLGSSSPFEMRLLNSYSGTPLAEPTRRFLPACETRQGQRRLARTLIRSMVAAANADGHIDGREHRRIAEAFETLPMTASEHRFLLEQFANPPSAGAVAAEADSPEVAAEIYLAAAMVSDMAAAPSRSFLDDLATRLDIDPDWRRELELQIQDSNPHATNQVA